MNSTRKIGYLGPEGTFTQEAVLHFASVHDNIIDYDNILKVFDAVENSLVDIAIVPIENSTEGSVGVTLDALAHMYDDIKIQYEISLPIVHNLLVQKGKTLDDINVICSHSQAIAQCRNFLTCIDKPIQSMSSTANAARYVSEFSSAAAIGNSYLQDRYNLEIINHAIQDQNNNLTRFVVIGKEDYSIPTGSDKTSIIFSLKGDKPGGLYEILYEFAKREINLTKIESRPSKRGMGKYIFFIDLEGHRCDNIIKDTLDVIFDKVEFMKIAGSYPTLKVEGGLK